MDMDEIMKKVGDKLNVARDTAMDLADKAGKKAGEVYDVAKLKIKLFDMRRDVNALYKEVGKDAYNAGLAGEDVAAAIASKCEEISRLQKEMEELAAEYKKEADEAFDLEAFEEADDAELE